MEEELVTSEKKSWWERKTGERLRLSEKIIGGVLLLLFLCALYITLDASKYAAQVKVIAGEGKVGVNPTTERLDFGDLSRGTSALRRVDIKNNSITPIFVSVVRLGNITDLMKLDKNNFVLHKGEEDHLEFTLYMPASAEIDKIYKGRVFIFKIPMLF